MSNTLTLIDSNIGYTYKAVVMATNFLGSASSIANQSAWVTNSTTAAYSFNRNMLDPTGGQCPGCATESLGTGDINKDGKIDIVVAGRSALSWYENANTSATSNSWVQHIVSSSWYGGGAETTVIDINKDGNLDVAVGESASGYQEVWFENTGSTWVKHTLSTSDYCHDLSFADLDGNGSLVGICADEQHGKITLLRSGADINTAWNTQIIDTRSTMGIEAADIDHDGLLDIVSGRAWYKNPGVTGTAWTRYTYASVVSSTYTGFNDYSKTNTIDLNGDGKLDIFATMFAETPEAEVWAFLAPDDPTTQAWAAVPIDRSKLFGVHSQQAANFDGSAVPQIMVGESNYGGWSFGPNPNPQIYIYRLIGPAEDPASWQRTAIDNLGTHEAVAVDLNGDGKVDIAGHDENTDFMSPPQNGPVRWWANNTQ